MRPENLRILSKLYAIELLTYLKEQMEQNCELTCKNKKQLLCIINFNIPTTYTVGY